MVDKYDDVLFSILKDTKTLPNFFDIVFGFLYRRTDFFHISTDSNLGIGLPPGVAEQLLKCTFNKYVETQEIPQIVHHEEFVIDETGEIVVHNDEVIEESPIIVQHEDFTVESPENLTDSDLINKDTFDSYNGAVFETYSWSQTITDIDVQIKIPEALTSKQLSVDITCSKICVKLKNGDTIYLNGDLCKKCKHQETIWSLDGLILQIHLEKTSESWWNCLVQSEPKLDFSKMDCSRPFHELSDEAQAKIEELTWNQERKRQGLPTSDQLELEKTLKKSWNVEGSPFTGDYDVSKVSLN